MYRRYDIWYDYYGRTRLISNNYSAAPFGNLDAAIMAASNAGILQSVGSDVLFVGGPVINAQFISVTDWASCVVVDSLGNQSSIIIPAPQTGIFMADGITVGPTTLAAIYAAAIADGYVNSLGNSPTAVISGLRYGRRLPP